jgi:hypothetical protein
MVVTSHLHSSLQRYLPRAVSRAAWQRQVHGNVGGRAHLGSIAADVLLGGELVTAGFALVECSSPSGRSTPLCDL